MKHPIPEILKRFGLAALLTVVSVPAFAQGDKVILLEKDGTCYELAIADTERINFKEQTVEFVAKSGAEKSVAYADVNRILIGGTLSGIQNLINDGKIAVYPAITDGAVSVAGAEAGTSVRVYSVGGVLVAQAVSAGDVLSLDLSGAPAGALFVQIGNHTVKIIKK